MNVFISGRPDLIGVRATGGKVIMDLKTSADFTPAWLQIGAYTMVESEQEGAVEAIGVIHASRKMCGAGDGWPEIFWNNQPEGCMQLAEAALDRIVHLIRNPGQALVSPAKHCRWCDHPSCPVRVKEYSSR